MPVCGLNQLMDLFMCPISSLHCMVWIHGFKEVLQRCWEFRSSCLTLLFFTVDDMDRITIENGMQDISTETCIKFVPRTHEANFLDIQPRYGWVWLWHVAFTRLCVWFLRCDVALWWWHVISVVHPKLLVVPGADWRKPDPVTADPWLHVVRSGCPRADARPWLCARAVSLRPRPLCHNCVEKHHARLGWMVTSQHYVTESLFFTVSALFSANGFYVLLCFDRPNA